MTEPAEIETVHGHILKLVQEPITNKADVTEAIFLAKNEKNMTWEEIASKIGMPRFGPPLPAWA